MGSSGHTREGIAKSRGSLAVILSIVSSLSYMWGQRPQKITQTRKVGENVVKVWTKQV